MLDELCEFNELLTEMASWVQIHNPDEAPALLRRTFAATDTWSQPLGFGSVAVSSDEPRWAPSTVQVIGLTKTADCSK